MYGSIIIKSNNQINDINLNFLIKIISPKIEIDRYFKGEQPEIIISELIELSQPNKLEKTIFIFPIKIHFSIKFTKYYILNF